MSGWRTLDIECSQCGTVSDLLVRTADVDKEHTCPECGYEKCTRMLSAPMVLRASHQSGYNRGPAWADLKEASKLKVERANLPHDKRGDIDKEISKRQKSAGKSYIKKEKGQ